MIFAFIACLLSEIMLLGIALGFLKFVLSENRLNCKDELIFSIICIVIAVCDMVAACVLMN